jgi:hypothetical protein
MATYQVRNGSVKVQVESMLGTKPSGGWVYQAPGKGNANAEGAHYYYRSQTAEGSHKSAPSAGRFGFDINVAEAGKYSILVRAARDTNNPGDARNDIWIRVDGDTQDVMPKGTKQLTDGGGGFVKFKGGISSKWSDLKVFSTPAHGDKNPWSDVIFDKGIHNITFAPRSTGLHIDSILIKKVGSVSNAVALDLTAEKETTAVKAAEPVKAAPEKATDTGVKGVETISTSIAAKHDDFESNKAAASDDLEFGSDGKGAQSVGLRFKGMDVDADAEIKSAHFVFTAAETSKGAARFQIEIEDTTSAKTYSKANGPDDRDYHDDTIVWNVAAWTEGKEYKSADVADLIEAVIEEGGLDALDALAFRISGSGERVADAYEAGNAPELVLSYA